MVAQLLRVDLRLGADASDALAVAVCHAHSRRHRDDRVIGFLRGTRLKTPPQLMVEVGGVGYEVEAPMSTFFICPRSAAKCACSRTWWCARTRRSSTASAPRMSAPVPQPAQGVGRRARKWRWRCSPASASKASPAACRTRMSAALTRSRHRPQDRRAAAGRDAGSARALSRSRRGRGCAVPERREPHRRRGLRRAGGTRLQARRSDALAQASPVPVHTPPKN